MKLGFLIVYWALWGWVIICHYFRPNPPCPKLPYQLLGAIGGVIGGAAYKYWALSGASLTSIDLIASTFTAVLLPWFIFCALCPTFMTKKR